MKNDTLTPAQTQTLLAATPKYVKAGLTPPWAGEDAWCDLEMELIGGRDAFDKNKTSVSYCPPAVAAAVIAWAHELIDYLHSKYYAHSFLQPTRWSMHAVDRDGMLVCEASGESVNKLAASVALISAVAEGLGEG